MNPMKLTVMRRFFPFMQWLPSLGRANLRPDMEAGLVGAILILPQAIALATLAGMPPEYGIYTSIFPVIVAMFWGSSWHTLSGPNTAVCVLIASSVAPFAAIGSEQYIGFVLALTFMAGLVQLAVGSLRLGAILDFVSHTVISAIVLAVGLIIIVFAANALLGVLSNLDEPFYIRLYQIIYDIPRANGYALLVGGLTIIAGLISRYYWRRYALVIAVAVGMLVAGTINLLVGSATSELELLGTLSISALPFSAPHFDLNSMAVLKALVTSALSIAFLGLMQTIVISRSIAAKSGQLIETNQEIIGQGLSNLVAPFISSFAGSGSFNRSAAHYDAGAKTPMAAVYASFILLLVVLVAAKLIAYIPLAAVAGALILVGIGLIDTKEIKQVLRSRQEAVIFFMTFISALVLGLNAGVFVGVLSSLVIYLWYASTPNIVLEEQTARDGRRVNIVTIDGGLFFGSVRHVERVLANLGERDGYNGSLIIRTDHMTYLDVPGATLIASEAKRRREHQGHLYIFVTREKILSALSQSTFFSEFGEDHIIQRNQDHPMKDVLYPSRMKKPTNEIQATDLKKKSSTTSQAHSKDLNETTALISSLQNTKLFSLLSTQQIEALLKESPTQQGNKGAIITDPEVPISEHFVLLKGRVDVERLWSLPKGGAKRSTSVMDPDQEASGIAVLQASGHGVRITANSAITYLLIDCEKFDELLGWNQQLADMTETDPETSRRMSLIKHTALFRQLPLENLKQALQSMTPRDVKGGETIIRQGETGDSYFLIESGEAGVWKKDTFSDETVYANTIAPAARLGPGDGFGEEALLQNGFRSATVMMATPGRLLVMDRQHFDAYIRPSSIIEIVPSEAIRFIEGNKVQWLDCRYDLEYSEAHIPNALHMPLDQLREQLVDLDRTKPCIVYSRNERRSRAAAFLLTEHNFKVKVLKGGIMLWPYDLENEKIE
ncbi:MAG: cyclic nucleotide-binding domain-containing protein [Gammaproteobacteria bacterium]|nr:cyclic nucleotide-binding domain-containing protein [Gammaproteobacteria bacterium]